MDEISNNSKKDKFTIDELQNAINTINDNNSTLDKINNLLNSLRSDKLNITFSDGNESVATIVPSKIKTNNEVAKVFSNNVDYILSQMAISLRQENSRIKTKYNIV